MGILNEALPTPVPNPLWTIVNPFSTIVGALPVFGGVLALIAGLQLLIGVLRLMHGYTQRQSGEEWAGPGVRGIWQGLLGLAGAFFIGQLMPLMFGALDDSAPASTAAPTATSTPTPSQAPSTTSPVQGTPVDWSWVWVTLAILGILCLTVAVIAGLVFLTVKARRAVRQSRAESERVREVADRQAAAWATFRDLHQTLLKRVLDAETDWDSLFFTPALTDPSVPETVAMWEAMRSAGVLRDTEGILPTGLSEDADIASLPYPRAVAAFDAAWETAKRKAIRVGQAGIPATDRKTIRKVRSLLDLAENAAASSTERDLAYRRIRALLGELETIHVPERATAALEQKHRLALEGHLSTNEGAR